MVERAHDTKEKLRAKEINGVNK